MRSVLDCGCVITEEGRHWCPSCADGGGGAGYVRVNRLRPLGQGIIETTRNINHDAALNDHAIELALLRERCAALEERLDKLEP